MRIFLAARRHTRAIGGVIVLVFGTFLAFAVVRGQQIPQGPFIPNGVFFPNPGGVANLQLDWPGH
jgi:hypothetical protein